MTHDELKALDDDRLASCAAADDAAALELLLERSAPTAVRVAYALLGNREDALDAAQTALLNVAREIGTGWSGTRFRAWLCSCVHHAAVNLLIQEKSRRKRDEVYARTRTQGEAQMGERLAEQQETLAMVREELARLPQETAAALVLFHLDGMPVAEVAQQTGLSEDACRQRLSRGRETLRERLERRGVALASAVFVSERLDEMSTSGRAFAGEVRPEVYAALARTAFAGRASVAANPPPLDRDSLTGRGGKAMPSRATGRETYMLRTFASAGVALTLLISSVVLLQEAPPATAGTPTQKSEDARGKAATEIEPVVPVAAETPATLGKAPENVASRWQTPRFIPGNYTPLSISAAGPRVALLAGEGTPSNGLKGFKQLVMFESSDTGQTWSKSAAFQGYSKGAVSMTENGDCALLAQVPGASEKIGSVSVVHAIRSELRLRQGTGNFGKAETVFARPDNSAIYASSGLHMTRDGMWAFGLCRGSPHMDFMVAVGSGGLAPKPLMKTWQARIFGPHSPAWAVDAKTAGFVIYSYEHKRLRSLTTKDGGQNWEETPVPFKFDRGSVAKRICVIPEAISRHEERLLLVVHVIIGVGEEHNDEEYQLFTLLSEDLGKTWGAPKPASDRSLDFYGDVKAHLLKDRMLVCNTRSAGFERVIQAIDADDDSTLCNAEVKVSEDGGDTWYQHHAFDPLSINVTAVVAGGTRDTVHVAVFRDAPTLGESEKNGGCMVIRSFTASEWKAPATPAPAWFKEEKMADPTKEDF